MSSQRLLILTIALATLSLPATCFAANVTTWNFVNQPRIDGWNMNALTSVRLTPQGLSIVTETQGQLIKTSDIAHAVDRISISYTSPTGGDGLFLWRPPQMHGTEVFQIPVTFVPTSNTQTLILDLRKIAEWDARSDRIGFTFNPGTNVTLQSIELSGPRFVDRIVFPLKTFFRMDQIRSYSVNFLWGPLMTYSEEQKNALYANFPPDADSWNGALYVILACGLVCALLLRKLGKRNAVTVFLGLFAVFWLLYDVRMGTEFIHFAKRDVKIWWSQPPELQDFRDRGSFTAFTKNIGQYVQGKEKFVFIASRGWPYWGAMRYEMYPAFPVSHEGDTEGIAMWLVYDRPDIQQDDEGRLTLDGKTISPPGDIVFLFDIGAFVFAVRPASSPN